MEKMKLLSKVTFHTYRDASLFSLVIVGILDILVVCNPSKRDTWKGKCEAMEKKCYAFQKKLVDLPGEIKLVEDL